VRLTWVPVPVPGARSITVSGKYPQITGPSGPALVNDALRSMIVKDSTTMQKNFGDTGGSTSVTYGGGDAFAGNAVVSILEKAVMRTDTGGGLLLDRRRLDGLGGLRGLLALPAPER